MEGNEMKLSRNFDLSEFVESDKAKELGIDNTITIEAIANLQLLVDKLLQPLRSLYGKPMHINSGYRCEDLNKAVGGTTYSQHRLGMAADVACKEPKVLYALLKASKLNFDQCGIYSNFLHLSYKATGNRNYTFYGKY
jgi:zinc D-Ala-D-Ala carboxypeptidase